MEFVWVVPRSIVFAGGHLRGFCALDAAELERAFLAPCRAAGFFMERRYAESHPEFKQPIPYVVVGREPPAGGCEILSLTRLKTQGEKRLHGLRSVGVGGHVNPCDAEPAAGSHDLLANACWRELHEELVLPSAPLRLTPLGVLNDDSTEVGAVHLGIVYRLDAGGLPVAIRETAAMTGNFEALARLQEAARRAPQSFESWSLLLLQSPGVFAAARPAGAGLIHS